MTQEVLIYKKNKTMTKQKNQPFQVYFAYGCEIFYVSLIYSRSAMVTLLPSLVWARWVFVHELINTKNLVDRVLNIFMYVFESLCADCFATKKLAST